MCISIARPVARAARLLRRGPLYLRRAPVEHLRQLWDGLLPDDALFLPPSQLVGAEKVWPPRFPSPRRLLVSAANRRASIRFMIEVVFPVVHSYGQSISNNTTAFLLEVVLHSCREGPPLPPSSFSASWTLLMMMIMMMS